MSERKRVGFVVDWLRDSYQLAVLRGAADEARERGADLVVLPGGVLGAAHDHGVRRNRVYQLISRERFDALVVMSGTLGNARDVDIMAEICPDFPPERICHTAIAVSGSPAVLVDNQRGVREMVEHLLRVHRCRRIAFIRGPESNEEAQARYDAYREALENNELPFDERLVCPGNFLRDAGTEAVRLLLDERRIPVDQLDAIMAADDLMALAAMEELRRRGLRVPSQVAVIGFDDVEEARYAAPPLSTVHQPLREQGRAAVDAVLDGAGAGSVLLETVNVFRRSCGCTAEDPGFLTVRPKSDTRMSLEASIERRRGAIITELEHAAERIGSGLKEGWAGELLDSILESVRGSEGAFREHFDWLLESALEVHANGEVGQAIVSGLRRQLSICAGEDIAQLRRVEGLLHDARILASHAMARAEAQRRIEMERSASVLSDVSVRLASMSPAQRIEGLAMQLPRLGVNHCLLCEYVGKDEARVVAHLQSGKSCTETRGKRYPAKDLTPAEGDFSWGEGNLIIHALDDGTAPTGFAILALSELEPYLLEVVRDLLCMTLGSRSGQ